MVKPTKTEQKALEAAATGSVGANLIAYMEKLCDSLCDVRQTPNMNDEQRIAVSKIIQENLIDKLRVIRGEIKIEDDGEDYE